MNLPYIATASIAISAFLVASLQDVRDREVSDVLWIISGSAGVAISIGLAVSVGAQPLQLLAASLPAFLFIDMFVDWNSLMGRSGQILRFSAGGLCAAFTLLSVYSFPYGQVSDLFASESLWILFILLLFYLDIIRGGADAKALAAIVLLFPAYPTPVIGRIPPAFESFTFPFFLNVLLIAAVISAFVSVYLFLRNAIRGDYSMPYMFLGKKKEVSNVKLQKEWLLEIPDENGNPVRVRKLGSISDSEALRRAVAFGWKNVWVSPKVPFIVPITVGLLVTLVIGSVIVYL
ncbi:MAG: hypothetical protein KIY12_05315 [Thermoplasmata archaeon]|uniref:Preflagellin peptidase C-terminal domain-containing protein n=1 Tax=Candidatus Sysuiplasma superficiale TaxID=2823368 RepID=A0A8J7YNS8_9ARCH|nr:hypothetical protein [Candidatus Sysuiplasma superficiale]MBX8644128.1 hypothetical protein [Candidatus Sysuiplasma superficiale]MCL4346471.1 hypothetical protein [Candidatus Thermoplasmatota archaeon]